MNTNTKLRDIIVASLVGALVGAFVSLVVSFATNLWVMPKRDKQQRNFQITEQRLSLLYQPIMIATANGNFSMTSDIPFYKVYRVMEQYGYLANPKLMTKYVEFLSSCRFASLADILTQTYVDPKISSDVLKEILKIRPENPPLAWTASTLPEALEKQKEFISLFKEDYQKALRNFEALLK